MWLRRVFTLDPYRFPIDLVRQLVNYLHGHDQHYIVMVDPAVAWQPNQTDPFNDGSEVYNSGLDAEAYLTFENGSVYRGVVWPGVTVYPDWFAPNTQDWWSQQFLNFFNPDTGVDIDAVSWL